MVPSSTRFAARAAVLVCLAVRAAGVGGAGEFPPVVNSQRTGERPPSPEEAAAAIAVPPGFKVTLFAGEPDVAQPIAIDFDDRGRLLVAECYTFAGRGFDPAHRDRVLILQDADGDGRFDGRKVFWDGGWALTGLAWGFDGLFVLNGGTLSHVPDQDRDDVPDGPPVVLLDGFNVEESEHNVVSGLTWGPDGWLYGRHGILATSRPGVPGTPEADRVRMNVGVWRYHPTRRVFEVVAEGTTNPWGLDYDADGQFFFTNNVIGHAWHLIPGAHYARMYGEDFNPHLYELIDQHADHYHWDTTGNWTESREGAHGADALGGGHSHCGGMIYLGDNWPAEYRGGLFMCNTHGRRVNHDVPVREGSGYVLKHAPDLIFANQPWFRGVSLAYGPDGGGYVTDWSDFGECHDHDGVHRTSGRIYKVTYGDPKPLPAGFDIAAFDDARLAAAFRHPNDWYVRRARRLLQERAAAGVNLSAAYPETIRDLGKLRPAPDAGGSPTVGLWSLHAAEQNSDLPGEALGGDDEQGRAAAIRILTDHRPVPPETAERLAGRSPSEASPFVRLHLASAMQRLDGEPRWRIAEALATHGEDADDHNLPLMIWYGLEPLVPTDVDRAVRLAETTPIPLLRRHVARRVAGLADENPQAMPKLTEFVARLDAPAARGDVLAGVAAALRGVRKMAPPAGWDRLRDELVGSNDPAVSGPARELAVVFGDGRATEDLKTLAADAEADPGARRAAIAVLVRSGEKDLAPLLHGLVTDRATASAAARGLAVVGDDRTPDRLLKDFWRAPADARHEIVAALTVRESWALALLDAVAEQEVPKDLVTPSDARQIASLGGGRVAARLNEVWGTVRATPDEIRGEIARLRSELTPDAIAGADLPNGRRLFDRLCANCHKLYGEGSAVAPDLTGSNRGSLDYLLENVLDPNATVPEAYRSSVVVLADGRILTGVVVGRSETRVTLQTATEKLTLDAADIEELRGTDQSLMPNGLLDRLSPQEIRDLVGYLSGKSQAQPVATP